MLKKIAIVLICSVGIFFLFNNLLMPWYVKHSDLVEVPSVIGMTFIEAKRVLENSGLQVKQGDVKYDETKPIGQILEQNPPAGQMVKGSRRIYLTVCGGEQLIDVPRLVGRSLRDARFYLQQRGLDIGETVKKFSNEFPDEYVISQIIQPGSKVKRDTKIDLIISNGPEIGNLRVPDVIGKSLQEAKNIITESKLKVGRITYIASSESPGKVLDQYPKKDKSANEQTAVDIFVSKLIIIEETVPLEEGDSEDNTKTTEPETNNDKTSPAPGIPKGSEQE
ncbi:MAG: PASTA domain-containing protein [Ignavibacteriaceae bacterium]|jgi:serine/threonine-protein kinase|nr:MAG: PASTA domain-containing protein [Chlorobiota bacterium]KXK05898.1 MAG: protein kinase [Chlorobi bacterium OLB4]MBV6398275.1 Serine/threonine-protein kinase PK-1 [Ignavibacteria bacterium]MCC6886132.1 PASTA domain-containing protein [Ignavibacteriales bacterium]MCE7952616.1 PASTA domain-containing protein [Chlorobi bacterium CHB7]MDL1886728.1 PASTA domain-containing protein [Ignavibacteria bacterium CHB1]MEB2329604.1 PASTA domain-containing protein [Ignavibacteriaceae bacterium]OQY777